MPMVPQCDSVNREFSTSRMVIHLGIGRHDFGMVGELFTIIVPVFACACIGYIWARREKPYDTDLVTTLITTIGAPCLILSTLTEADIEVGAFGAMAAAAVVSFLITAGIAIFVLKMAGLSVRAFMPPLIFPNCGNMGLPLCLFAYGEQGLALGIVIFAVSAVSMFTIGSAVASGSISLNKLARIPVLYAVAAALIFMVGDIQPPEWFANTTRILGGMTVPMMLITLGVSLARLRISSFWRSLALSLFRLAMGFAVGVALAEVFGFEGPARGVLILQTSMPVAVFTFLFAQRYKREPEEVAGMVMLSTAASFLTLPALLWYVL